MRRLVLLTILALGTTAVQADSDLFYVGAGATYSSLTASNNGYIAYGEPELKNTSWKAFAGVRPLKWLVVEAEYIDLGSGSTSYFTNEYTDTTHAESSAWAAYAIGFLPVPLPAVGRIPMRAAAVSIPTTSAPCDCQKLKKTDSDATVAVLLSTSNPSYSRRTPNILTCACTPRAPGKVSAAVTPRCGYGTGLNEIGDLDRGRRELPARDPHLPVESVCA
jgi:hypothetical protein